MQEPLIARANSRCWLKHVKIARYLPHETGLLQATTRGGVSHRAHLHVKVEDLPELYGVVQRMHILVLHHPKHVLEENNFTGRDCKTALLIQPKFFLRPLQEPPQQRMIDVLRANHEAPPLPPHIYCQVALRRKLVLVLVLITFAIH